MAIEIVGGREPLTMNITTIALIPSFPHTRFKIDGFGGDASVTKPSCPPFWELVATGAFVFPVLEEELCMLWNSGEGPEMLPIFSISSLCGLGRLSVVIKDERSIADGLRLSK